MQVRLYHFLLLAASFGTVVVNCKETSSSSTCLPCSILTSAAHDIALNHSIEQTVSKIQGISVVLFEIRGLQFDAKLLESSDVFDPTWWSWSRSADDVFYSFPPLTMEILSLNTMTFTVSTVDVHVDASEPGCTLNMSIECLTSRIAALLVQVVRPIRAEAQRVESKHTATPMKPDVLCESSFVGETKSALGWRCLPLTAVNLLHVINNEDVGPLMSHSTSIAMELARLAVIMALLLPTIPVIRRLLEILGCKQTCLCTSAKQTQSHSSQDNLAERSAPSCISEVHRKSVHYVLNGVSYHIASTQNELEQTLHSVVHEVDEMQNKLAHGIHRLKKQDDKVADNDLRDESKYEYFELRKASSPTSCKHWVIVKKDELLGHKSAAPFLRLLEQSLLNAHTLWGNVWYIIICDFEIILKSSAFLGAHICIIYWVCSYAPLRHRLAYLNTDARIFLNLGAAPLSWYFVNPSVFFCLACFGGLVHCVFIIVVLLPAVVRIIGPASMKRHRLFAQPLSDLELAYPARVLLSLLIVLEYINIDALVASLSSSFLYLLVGVIVNIKMLAPLLTAVVTFGYYLSTFFHGVTGKYTQLKRMLFKFATDPKNIKWKAYKCEAKSDGTVSRVQLDGVVFFDTEQHTHSLVFQQLLDVSVDFYPISPRLCKALLRLVMEMQFIGLVGFVMLSFRSSIYQDNTNIVIATIVSLLSSLIPKFIDSLTGVETKKLREAALESRIGFYVTDPERKYTYHVVVSSDCNCEEFQTAIESKNLSPEETLQVEVCV